MEKFKTTMLQNQAEFAWFLDILRREEVRSYLEIGSKHGGSFWQAVNALPVGSRAVAVDLPGGSDHLDDCVRQLRSDGYDAYLYRGDSTKIETIEAICAFAPFDACLIDGGHKLTEVTSDWKNYGPMACIVAFHDINWKARPAPSNKEPIEVPILWESIRGDYKHEEICLEPRDLGIGVLWRS